MKLLFGPIVAMLGLIGFAAYEDSVDHEQWNTECIKDHKQYECTTMWRAGQSSVQPVPIIITTTR